MTRRWIVASILVAVLGALAVGAAVSRPGAVPPAGIATEHWRAIATDLGIVLRDDDHGAMRGTVMIRVDGVWRPVAVDGATELGPKIYPLER